MPKLLKLRLIILGRNRDRIGLPGGTPDTEGDFQPLGGSGPCDELDLPDREDELPGGGGPGPGQNREGIGQVRPEARIDPLSERPTDDPSGRNPENPLALDASRANLKDQEA